MSRSVSASKSSRSLSANETADVVSLRNGDLISDFDVVATIVLPADEATDVLPLRDGDLEPDFDLDATDVFFVARGG